MDAFIVIIGIILFFAAVAGIIKFLSWVFPGFDRWLDKFIE